MDTEHYYHMFANGDDAKNFITTEEEFKSAFNRFAVCAISTEAKVLSFNVEDTHPHALLWGTHETCTRFKKLYGDMSIRSIVQSRGSAEGVSLHCELYEIDDINYLRNVGTYTIIQVTKDGKAVMPYDYRYGTGALYFRNKYSAVPWLFDDEGNYCPRVRFDSLTVREQKRICPSRQKVPGGWLVANGFILPENYVDVRRFESIYGTHNCYRVFLGMNRKNDVEILSKMAEIRGVRIEDFEARRLCREACMRLFGVETTRTLSLSQRMELARNLRLKGVAFRQLALLVHVPESEMRKYVK